MRMRSGDVMPMERVYSEKGRFRAEFACEDCLKYQCWVNDVRRVLLGVCSLITRSKAYY